MTVERGPNNPQRRPTLAEIRGRFVEDHITRMRRTRLVGLYGEEEGDRRMKVEIGFLNQIITFLDTPGSDDPARRGAFAGTLRAEAAAAGYNISELIRRGRKMYPAWLAAKRAAEAQGYRGTMSRSATDPHVALEDGSHRRGGDPN
jgi:hypothetical protein